jgi:hypothetical protein
VGFLKTSFAEINFNEIDAEVGFEIMASAVNLSMLFPPSHLVDTSIENHE